MQVGKIKILKQVIKIYKQTEKYLIWNDGEYVYVIVSTIVSLENMVKFAESVK